MSYIVGSCCVQPQKSKLTKYTVFRERPLTVYNKFPKVSAPPVPLSTSSKYYNKKCTAIHCCTHQQTIYAYKQKILKWPVFDYVLVRIKLKSLFNSAVLQWNGCVLQNYLRRLRKFTSNLNVCIAYSWQHGLQD